jgi:hypothetical protein
MADSWNLKLTFCLIETNSWTTALSQTKFGTMKDHDIPTSIIWIILLCNGPSEYGHGGIFKLLRWIQTLYQSTWDHETWYADRSSKDKQLLIRPLLWKSKNTNMAGSWKLKFTLHFMERTHELLHLRQMTCCTLKDHGHAYNLHLNRYFPWRSFWIWWWLEILNYFV